MKADLWKVVEEKWEDGELLLRGETPYPNEKAAVSAGAEREKHWRENVIPNERVSMQVYVVSPNWKGVH